MDISEAVQHLGIDYMRYTSILFFMLHFFLWSFKGFSYLFYSLYFILNLHLKFTASEISKHRLTRSTLNFNVTE